MVFLSLCERSLMLMGKVDLAYLSIYAMNRSDEVKCLNNINNRRIVDEALLY